MQWTFESRFAHGGQGSAAEPFDLFLASLGTCAGIYVLGFCQARGISTEGIELRQHSDFENGQLKRVRLEIVLPESFPPKYQQAVVRAAEGCKVKKVLAAPPEITVTATIAGVPSALASPTAAGAAMPPEPEAGPSSLRAAS
jgi:ribosomal protein S12 methylthiotransferase accessory factor